MSSAHDPALMILHLHSFTSQRENTEALKLLKSESHFKKQFQKVTGPFFSTVSVILPTAGLQIQRAASRKGAALLAQQGPQQSQLRTPTALPDSVSKISSALLALILCCIPLCFLGSHQASHGAVWEHYPLTHGPALTRRIQIHHLYDSSSICAPQPVLCYLWLDGLPQFWVDLYLPWISFRSRHTCRIPSCRP